MKNENCLMSLLNEALVLRLIGIIFKKILLNIS